jgi:hypothetical protein
MKKRQKLGVALMTSPILAMFAAIIVVNGWYGVAVVAGVTTLVGLVFLGARLAAS